MKNSVFFKFLAIVLCAASLMGTIGGAAGVLALVEQDLYNKTIDEVIAAKAERYAAEFATQTAYRYADQVLGGCPEALNRSQGYNNILERNYTSYGYSILDAEGNVLESLNPELKSSVKTYSTPVTGQYMHLVSAQTESQAKEAAARKRWDSYSGWLTDNDGDLVPPEGISVHHVIFTDQEGHVLYEATSDGMTGSSTYFYRDYLLENGIVDTFSNFYDHMSSRTGFLYYNADRQLAYTSFLEEHENPFQMTVYGVMFFNGDRGFQFQSDNPEGIGTLSNESGCLVFTSFARLQEETVEETVPETVPETTAETQPEETVAETQAEETVAETEATEYIEETAPTEDTYEEESYSEDSGEYYEEGSEEDSGEYYEEGSEESAASDVPEEYSEEEWSEGSEEEWSEDSGEEEWTDDSGEEEWTEEPQETVPKETVPQETIPQETVPAASDYSHLTEPAEKRIYLEWLLSKNLITEKDLPTDLISDKDLRDWLVYNKLIRPEQTFPNKDEETSAAPAEPLLINGKPLESYQVNETEYHDPRTGERTVAKYVYLPMPELTVEVYVSPSAMRDATVYSILGLLQQYRAALLPIIGICLLLFALTAIYLCSAAGRSPKTEGIQARGINRMPLDLYLVLGCTIGCAVLALAFGGVPLLLGSDLVLGCSLAASAAFLVCLIFTGFCFAIAAQFKTGGGFWWRQTLSVRFIFLFMRYAEAFGIWVKEKAWPALLGFSKKAGQRSVKFLFFLHERTDKLIARTGSAMDRFFSLIPMTWQWLIGGLVIILFALLVNTGRILLILLGIFVPVAIVLYVTHCFGILSDSTKRMVKGNLNTKIEDKFMTGCFRDFATDLNELAGVANVAAQKQLKSERMKTELITNVSHDIKTPLTSIINYVDLLQKPHSAEEESQYLEVLDRQSQRLKKLVDDLMDMSKASTGNMAVEISYVDLVESVNQALGEFSGKLEYAQLYPVFRHSEDSVPVIADGKLVWRVLSNLLSNIVKYAMPRTRIYLDLTRMNGKVILSMKNISQDALNINAEELMERFVRGDVSRNTDGSGLGLNIAKSLMELQGGQLQMIVDGDLFKVTLIFPDGR